MLFDLAVTLGGSAKYRDQAAPVPSEARKAMMAGYWGYRIALEAERLATNRITSRFHYRDLQPSTELARNEVQAGLKALAEISRSLKEREQPQPKKRRRRGRHRKPEGLINPMTYW